MSALMSETETERWLSSPIVNHVRRTYNPADTLELLEGILLVCDELEDRFPGVPFRQIVAVSDGPSPWPTLRALMRNQSVSVEDVCTLFERYEYRKPAPSPGCHGRFEGMTADYFEDIRAHGHSTAKLRSLGYGHTPCNDMHFAWWWNLPDDRLLELHSGVRRCQRRLDDQDRFDRMISMVFCDDMPLTQVAAVFDVNASTVSKICGAFMYQLWLATEGQLP